MSSTDFTIIIPIYNTDPAFLKEAADSIYSQKQQNIEVILVNDGTTNKKTLKTLDKIKHYQNFKYIDTKHTGISNARNTGIKESTKNYIMFLDSDDKLTPDSLNILKKSLKKNPDILFFNYTTLNNGFPTEHKIPEHGIKQLKNTENLLTADIVGKNYNYSFLYPWGKIIKKSLIIENNITFHENLNDGGEDVVFSIQILNKANTIEYINKNCYIYRTHGGSKTNDWGKDGNEAIQKIISAYKKYSEELKKLHEEKFIKNKTKNLLIYYNIQDINQKIQKQNASIKNKRKDIIANLNMAIYSESIKQLKTKDFNTKRKKILFKIYERKNYFLIYIISFLKIKSS